MRLGSLFQLAMSTASGGWRIATLANCSSKEGGASSVGGVVSPGTASTDAASSFWQGRRASAQRSRGMGMGFAQCSLTLISILGQDLPSGGGEAPFARRRRRRQWRRICSGARA